MEGKSLSLRDNRSASVKSRPGGFLAFSCFPTHSTLRSRWLLSAGTPDGGTGTTCAAGQQPASEYLGKLLQPVASAAAYGYFEQIHHDMVLVSAALRLDCRPTRGRKPDFVDEKLKCASCQHAAAFRPARRKPRQCRCDGRLSRFQVVQVRQGEADLQQVHRLPHRFPRRVSRLCFLSGHPWC